MEQKIPVESLKMTYAALSFIETSFYFVTWVAAVMYASYAVFDDLNSRYLWFDGNTSWYDYWNTQDQEWSTWVGFYLYMVPWLISHFIGAELLRRNNRDLLPVWYILISVVFLLNFAGAVATSFVLLQVIILFAVLFTRSRLLLWAAAMGLLVFYQLHQDLEFLPMDKKGQYLMAVATAWLLLRSLSFGLDKLNAPVRTSLTVIDFVHCLSYCLYLPVLFLGPLILYEDFYHGLHQPFRPWNSVHRIGGALLSLLRFIFWAAITQIILYQMDFNIYIGNPEDVSNVSNWVLYGFGYCTGQYFMLKYTVFYGMGSAIARLEQINAPPHPRCIACIHLYSYMWKYFDRGLYLFLVKYIYTPFLGYKPHFIKKFLASVICFVFIYVWHSMQMAVFIWTLLNFIGVTIEGIAKLVSQQAWYQEWETSRFSPEGVRRFHAFLGTPMLITSAVSNFYFLCSYEIGNVFVERLKDDLFHEPSYIVYLFFFCYCCCQVSLEMSNVQQKRIETKKSKAF